MSVEMDVNPPLYIGRNQFGERHVRQGELYAIVLAMVRERGLACLHGINTSMLSQGWPDLVVMGRDGMIFRRLLTEHGQTTAQQAGVIAGLRRAYCDADYWRPQDLDGRIQAELDALGSPPEIAPVQVICENCERLFETVREDERFCCRNCWSAHHQRSKKLKKATAEAAAS